MSNRHCRRAGFCGLMIMLAGAGCRPAPGGSPSPAASAAPARKAGFVVYASFYPLAYFAERIGGSHVTVRCPVPPDADPAFWMPGPELVREFQQADVILVNGAGLEKWVGKISLEESRLVDTTESIADQYIVLPGAVKHSHGPAGEHTHEGVDVHTWLDPVLARVQAEAVLEAFVSRFPAPSEEFHANFEALAADLDALAARAEEVSGRLRGNVLLASHPAYNYLARRYGWNVQSFALDPAGDISAEDWEGIRNLADTTPVLLMLWEQPPRKAVDDKLLDELGITGVYFSPVERLDPAEAARGQDYLKLMFANFDRLVEQLGPPAPSASPTPP